MARIVKIAVLLPATLFLCPLVVGGLFGNLIAAFAWIVKPDMTGAEKFAMVRDIASQVALQAAALVGMAGAWSAVLREGDLGRMHRARRLALLAALIAGLWAAIDWVALIVHRQYLHGFREWAVWIALLGGPLLLGAYYVGYLLAGLGSPKPRPMEAHREP